MNLNFRRAGILLFQIERLQKIKQILLQKKSISVTELSESMNVSEITIRRDFEKLEQEGFLTRTHGGAVLNVLPFFAQTAAPEEDGLDSFHVSQGNRELGGICSDIVEDYDVIFLTRCPSNLALANDLKDKAEVVVVTNSLEIVEVMKKHTKNKVILLGGEVDYDRMCTRHGSLGAKGNPIKIGKAFIHVQGIDFNNGITVNDYEDKVMYDMLKQSSSEIIIMAEGTLFGKTGLIKLDDIDSVATLVTDDHIPYDYKNSFFRRGVRLYQKFDLK